MALASISAHHLLRAQGQYDCDVEALSSGKGET